MSKKTIIIICVVAVILLGVGAYWFFVVKKKPAASGGTANAPAESTDAMKQAILAALASIESTENLDKIKRMTGDEIKVLHEYVFDYTLKGSTPTPGSPLWNKLNEIQIKYAYNKLV
jgi:hypothetical protein